MSVSNLSSATDEYQPSLLGQSMMSTSGINDTNKLFEAVKNGRSNLQTLVDEWIEQYRQDREGAIIELLNFIVKSSGCNGRITQRMRETMDNSVLIRSLVDEFDIDGTDYPLVMSGPQWKKFRQTFCEFINTLIKQCQYSVIYDQYMMESFISFLISLSDSQVRAFRHTATLVAMKLMTALVDVALTLSINFDNISRQCEQERRKVDARRRANERFDSLMLRRQETEVNMEDIRTMLGYLFKSIFVHRYRDTFAEIRSICMQEIGVWMRRFPNHFLDDSYLKYVGWTLHDKMGEVRLKCLNTLLPLYESEEIARKMELFTNKFKDRVLAMTLDKESEVAVKAVKLIISIHRYHREILGPKDCEHVYELVFATNRSVACAAGEFLNERLFQVDEESTRGLRTRRGKKRSMHTPLIRDLIQFYIESELHTHGAYLVDALIESHPMMKDWECMSDLLLEEPGPDEEPLNDQQESSLIEIMVCCVRQAATGESPVLRGTQRRQLSAKESKAIQDDRQHISEHFIVTLQKLLDKYKTDKDKVSNLMQIPQYFELNLLTQHSDQLCDLLVLIQQLVEIHNDEEVLESCAKTLLYLNDDTFTFGRNVSLSIGEILDALRDKYYTAGDNYTTNPEGDEERMMLSLAIYKISVFNSCHDMSAMINWRDMFDKWIRNRNQESEMVPYEATQYAVGFCHMALIWELNRTILNDTETESLKKMLYEFVLECHSMLSYGNQCLRDGVYKALCDTLVVFSPKLSETLPRYSNLSFQVDRHLVNSLEQFLESRVFVPDEEVDEQKRILSLHQRRHFLSAYCKLIVYNIVPIRHAACVIKHYVRYSLPYGDIIKNTLSKIREINRVACARTMAVALIDLFSQIRQESTGNPNAYTRQDENFQALKELGKRFALSFGLDLMRNRDAVAALHKSGIQFTFTTVENPDSILGPPPNLPFLEILSEFSNKLLRQDKRTVLAYLERYVRTALPGQHSVEEQSLISYRNSLQQSTDFDMPTNRAPAPRHYSKGKKRGHDEGDGEDVPDDDQSVTSGMTGD